MVTGASSAEVHPRQTRASSRCLHGQTIQHNSAKRWSKLITPNLNNLNTVHVTSCDYEQRQQIRCSANSGKQHEAAIQAESQTSFEPRISNLATSSCPKLATRSKKNLKFLFGAVHLRCCMMLHTLSPVYKPLGFGISKPNGLNCVFLIQSHPSGNCVNLLSESCSCIPHG